MQKKIASGEKEGKITTKDGSDIKILTFDAHLSYGFCIIALYHKEDGDEAVETYRPDGSVLASGAFCQKDLIIEVPIAQEKESAPFKPFDKVLVREDKDDFWHPDIFSMWHGQFAECMGHDAIEYIIPYEGNEHLVGTTNKPKK